MLLPFAFQFLVYKDCWIPKSSWCFKVSPSEASLPKDVESGELLQWIPTRNGAAFYVPCNCPLWWKDSDIGSNNTQDLGGDIFKHWFIIIIIII